MYIANKVFKQEWFVSATDDATDDEYLDEDEESNATSEPSKKKKHRKSLDYILPSRRAVAKIVENASMLSFADMAEVIQTTHENGKVVTYGCDDIIKAAENKRMDIKTTRISVIDKDKSRETFTSGFYRNASHSGVSAAETVRHHIAKMAVLTNSSYDDMINYMDLFMNDRAGDGDTMLDELHIEESRRLKCSAHILLAVDVAVDKVFKEVEA